MFVVGILSWWYGAGWRRQLTAWNLRTASLLDYFSIGLLLKTLASPYRQISAGSVDGSIGIKWRAFVDRTVSRVIGFVCRLVLIIVGVVGLIVTTIYSVLIVAVWVIVPLFPIIGIVLWISGWVPAW